MTEEQANQIATELAKRIGTRGWSVTVSQTAGGKWRVVIHWPDGREPLAIYSARLLQMPIYV